MMLKDGKLFDPWPNDMSRSGKDSKVHRRVARVKEKRFWKKEERKNRFQEEMTQLDRQAPERKIFKKLIRSYEREFVAPALNKWRELETQYINSLNIN